MTVFALRMARFRNAVSRRHGEVARKMWSSLWPAWSTHQDRPAIWELLGEIPDEDLWHLLHPGRLVG
jgi:hypothetical protein